VRRLSSLGFVLAALLAAAGSAVAQAPPPAPQPPPLTAAVETCAASALPAQRVASFVGSMPALAGAAVMQMRFDLERRMRGEPRWRSLRGIPGFGIWERSEPRRAGFVFHKRVDSLPVPASYRVVVGFRWEDADGRLVRRTERRTAACAQPDMRPNLVPGPLTGVFDVRPGLAVYRLVVRNTGRAAAPPFGVRVGGGTAEVAGLAPQQERTVLVIAPICLAGTATPTAVDVDGRVDESSERENAGARRCPLWAG
jgi:hypothetical protein